MSRRVKCGTRSFALTLAPAQERPHDRLQPADQGRPLRHQARLGASASSPRSESPTDGAQPQELASTVGYWPQFVLASSISNMIDLASMGLIGQKAGFTASLDQQLKSILEVTATALSSVAAATRARSAAALAATTSQKEVVARREAVATQLRTEGVRDGRLDAVAGNGVVAELGGGIEGPAAGVERDVGPDVKVEIVGPTSSMVVKEAARVTAIAESAASSEDSAATAGTAVERLPVVVIKGFAAKGEAKQEVLWDVLSEWAAVLVENQVRLHSRRSSLAS